MSPGLAKLSMVALLSAGPVFTLASIALPLAAFRDGVPVSFTVVVISLAFFIVGTLLTRVLARLLRERIVHSLRLEQGVLVLASGSRVVHLTPDEVAVLHPAADIFYPVPYWFRWYGPRFSGVRIVSHQRMLGGTLSYGCEGCILPPSLVGELRKAGFQVDLLRSWT